MKMMKKDKEEDGEEDEEYRQEEETGEKEKSNKAKTGAYTRWKLINPLFAPSSSLPIGHTELQHCTFVYAISSAWNAEPLFLSPEIKAAFILLVSAWGILNISLFSFELPHNLLYYLLHCGTIICLKLISSTLV